MVHTKNIVNLITNGLSFKKNEKKYSKGTLRC